MTRLQVGARVAKGAAPAPPVREYKLLLGQHVGADLTEPPAVWKDPLSGVMLRRWPARTYAAGETVPSEIDLVKRFGAEKFQYLGDPSPDSVYYGSGWQPSSVGGAVTEKTEHTGSSAGEQQRADQASLLTSYASSPTAESSSSSSPKEPEGAPEDSASHGRRRRS